MKKKIYFARPKSNYGTVLDKNDQELIRIMGFIVHDPNKEGLEKEYREGGGMDVYLREVDKCEALIFRSFPDGKISAGVAKEIERARSAGKAVLELPHDTYYRTLTVEETRARL